MIDPIPNLSPEEADNLLKTFKEVYVEILQDLKQVERHREDIRELERLYTLE
jgi:hypothetical protein